MTIEPSTLEINLTLSLGALAESFYRDYVQRLPLHGDETVLDFGSGSGVCSRHLARRLSPAGKLLCVDISRAWQTVIRQTLRRYSNVEYLLGDIRTLSIPEASCDAIFIHFVLHDIPAAERERILRALAGKLKPGGQWFIREPLGDHGIQPGEVRRLLAHAAYRETYAATGRYWFTGPVYEGIYHEHPTAC